MMRMMVQRDDRIIIEGSIDKKELTKKFQSRHQIILVIIRPT